MTGCFVEVERYIVLKVSRKVITIDLDVGNVEGRGSGGV